MINEKYIIGFFAIILSTIMFFNITESDYTVIKTNNIKVFSVINNKKERLKLKEEEQKRLEESIYHSPFNPKIWNSVETLDYFISDTNSFNCNFENTLTMCETNSNNCFINKKNVMLKFPVKYNNITNKWETDFLLNNIDIASNHLAFKKVDLEFKNDNNNISIDHKNTRCITEKKYCINSKDNIGLLIKEIFKTHNYNEILADFKLNQLLEKQNKCLLEHLKLKPLKVHVNCYTYNYLCNENDIINNQEELENLQKIVFCSTMQQNCIN